MSQEDSPIDVLISSKEKPGKTCSLSQIYPFFPVQNLCLLEVSGHLKEECVVYMVTILFSEVETHSVP
jgi:hypothetical protein